MSTPRIDSMDAADGPTPPTMPPAPLAALAFRPATVADHARVVAVIPDWWGLPGTESLWRLLPRLFFQHFAATSTIVEDRDADGGLAAFLIGFRSQSSPDAAYIHFVGVRPDLRRHGLARV